MIKLRAVSWKLFKRNSVSFSRPQTIDGNLSNRSLIIPERRGLIQVSDPLVGAALRCVEHRSRPRRSRQILETARIAAPRRRIVTK